MSGRDSFLDAHEAAPRFYVLSPHFEPLSLRDQMLRAQWLVERLEQKHATTGLGRVVVVGAGAAGVSAAMLALKAGAEKVVIIEQHSEPFSRQAKCDTRWIDPTQYDWPKPSFISGKYPVIGSSPLTFSKGPASELANGWKQQLKEAADKSQKLEVRYLTRVSDDPADMRKLDDGWELRLKTSGDDIAAEKVTSNLLIWAAGFGREKCEIINLFDPLVPIKYQGVEFWADDHLETYKCGMPEIEKPTVAIIGGGDGAIQDALRALTKRRSAVEILQKLFTPEQQQSSFARTVLLAEEEIHRHWVWADLHGRRDHDVNEALDEKHKRAVQEALDQIPDLRKRVLELVRWDAEVTVFHRCRHLRYIYPLNRFLAHLFNHVLSESFLIPNLSVVDANRVGNDWSLLFASHQDCTSRLEGAHFNENGGVVSGNFQVAATVSANLVVIRQGIDGNISSKQWPSYVVLKRTRHSLPENPALY